MPKKIAPLSVCEPESKNYSKGFVEAAAATQIVCGVLAAVFNILFIYYGMASGWYYFKDSLGTEMKVISIGEGIMAGLFYMSFGSVFLYTLQSSGPSNGSSLLICSVMNILISLALILTNTCQLGLVSWYLPSSTTAGSYPDIERSAMAKVEEQQVRQTVTRTENSSSQTNDI